ncbi:MAG: aspartate-semialdehyde dehydrogenase [Gammaproteobacteria bacterium]|nr:aspartate-semialdehyde dehydrogenase [Gammaproteobacteria bacterium]
MSDFLLAHDHLLAAVQKDGYAGWDPFDGLNSRLFRALGLARFPLARLAWIQLFKRSPINFRPLTGVPKARNPKGIALFILALLEDFARTGQTRCRDEAVALGEWLLGQRCEPRLWGEAAWGYHFDWQARAFHVPTGKPNIITTVYVGLSLKALAELTGREDFAKALRQACEFIAERMYAEGEAGPYFRYIPGEPALVHNASLWGAALAGLGASLCDEPEYAERARRAVETSLRAQEPDGSWPYGKRGHHAFVDSFHTGFNLEALHRYRQWTGDESVSAAIASGLAYYRDNFFLADGTPKYYNAGVYPIDMHCTAQAVLTLVRVGGSDGDRALARRVLDWSCANMRDAGSGLFYYQREKYFTNRIPYVRWTEAWMLYALAVALREGL